MERLTVLILGGYGTFGGRLARLLADEPRLTLVIAGRSHAKARAFCEGLQASATLVPLTFDRDGAVEAQLRAVAPDLVVDASGPFQAYGADAYRVVEAALALGINYLDLADGADFVSGIGRFDAEARAHGAFVLAGVSSFPVLTAAVVRRLLPGLARLDGVTGGIAPSPYANVGLNVIRAIASYAGRPVKLVRDGRSAIGYGLVESRCFTIAPPGRMPLRPIRFSLVDVPDLRVLPLLWPSLRAVWMGAGPVPAIWHRSLSLLAAAVRLKLLPSLVPLAGLMHATMNQLSFGEHRGGMFIEVEGADADGRKLTRSWHLLAEGEDGPLIPSMAAEAIVRRCLAGKSPQPGARAAATDLELADYEALFARRRIFTGVRQSAADDEPLYRRLLGAAWDLLPPALRTMHDGTPSAQGRAVIDRGHGLLARLVASIVGFPPEGREVPVTVRFDAACGREHWQRTFGDGVRVHRFSSLQEQGGGRFEHLLCERFGPFRFGLALVVDEDRLWLVLRGWSMFGLPLPLILGPRIEAHESAPDGCFHFHVEIAHPLMGLIVRYRGSLAPSR